jgi:hypothetical protein
MEAESGGSNEPSSIEQAPVHRMIVMGVRNRPRLWFAQFDALG